MDFLKNPFHMSSTLQNLNKCYVGQIEREGKHANIFSLIKCHKEIRKSVALFLIDLSMIPRLLCNWLSINSQIQLQVKIRTVTLILISITAMPHYQANERIFRRNRYKNLAFSLQKIISSYWLLYSLVIMLLITLPTELKSFQRDPREFIAKMLCLLLQTLDFPLITNKARDLLMPVWGLNVHPNRIRMLLHASQYPSISVNDLYYPWGSCYPYFKTGLFSKNHP